MNLLKLIPVFAIVVLCWGCASTLDEKLSTKLDKVHRNMKSESVLEVLGEPESRVSSSDTTEVWIYHDKAFSQRQNRVVPVEYLLYVENGYVSSYDYIRDDY